MKFFTPMALLAAALLSALVALPFSPSAKMRPDLFMIEARVTSSVAAPFQIFYDDGAGIRETLSGTVQLVPGNAPVTYRLPLPPGVYGTILLDPLDRAGTITIASLRVISQ